MWNYCLSCICQQILWCSSSRNFCPQRPCFMGVLARPGCPNHSVRVYQWCQLSLLVSAGLSDSESTAVIPGRVGPEVLNGTYWPEAMIPAVASLQRRTSGTVWAAGQRFKLLSSAWLQTTGRWLATVTRTAAGRSDSTWTWRLRLAAAAARRHLHWHTTGKNQICMCFWLKFFKIRF